MQTDKARALIQRRCGRYMAQILEEFEVRVEPHLPANGSADGQKFKAVVRQRLQAFSIDAQDVVGLGDDQQNGAAIDLRDHVAPHGRPE